jgi:uncharacterized protein HemY
MSIPEDHVRRLEENLGAQERWMATLRRRIEGLQDEVSACETMLTLGRDPNLLRALGELYDRPKLFEQAADDPRAFFQERGVRVPDGADVTVRATTLNRRPQRYAVEARFETATLRYGVGWSPRAGFYAIAEEFPRGADVISAEASEWR